MMNGPNMLHINIAKLDMEDKARVDFVEKLYVASFPTDERRPAKMFFELHIRNPFFNVFLLTGTDEKALGFLSYWNFRSFVYAEHFAVSPESRNTGFGKAALSMFTKRLKKPLVLEVELPITELSKRRIGFYKRLGFKHWDMVSYKQPAYRKGGREIPMQLMTFGNIDLDKHLMAVKRIIYKNVYNYMI